MKGRWRVCDNERAQRYNEREDRERKKAIVIKVE